jgi:chromosome segregation ATPase
MNLLVAGYSLKELIADVGNLILPALTALFAWYVGKRKAKADAASSELENVQKAIQIWREVAQDMEMKCDRLLLELEAMKKQNRGLISDIAGLRKENKELKLLIADLEKKLPKQ